MVLPTPHIPVYRTSFGQKPAYEPMTFYELKTHANFPDGKQIPVGYSGFIITTPTRNLDELIGFCAKKTTTERGREVTVYDYAPAGENALKRLAEARETIEKKVSSLQKSAVEKSSLGKAMDYFFGIAEHAGMLIALPSAEIYEATLRPSSENEPPEKRITPYTLTPEDIKNAVRARFLKEVRGPGMKGKPSIYVHLDDKLIEDALGIKSAGISTKDSLDERAIHSGEPIPQSKLLDNP